MTPRSFINALLRGPYAWPGGYPLFFWTADGGALAFGTAWEERDAILAALRDGDRRGGWFVEGVDVNWEDPELFDDHTGKRIESAYTEDDASGKPAPLPRGYRDWARRTTARQPPED